ncbi:hypothetical protein [Nonomuraea sp. NPDC049784]
MTRRVLTADMLNDAGGSVEALNGGRTVAAAETPQTTDILSAWHARR